MDCFCSIGVMPLNMAAGAAFKCDDCKKWWIYNGQDWESRGISAGEQQAATHLTIKLTRFEAKQVVRSLKKRCQMLRVAEISGGKEALEKLIATEVVLSDLQPFVDGE